ELIWTPRDRNISEQCVCSSLSLSVSSAATFVVNVTQSSYEAEENHSITLEWTFTTEPDSCLKFKFIIYTLITDDKLSVLFHEHDGVEVPMSQDKQFAGRVQSDKDVLPEGRTRLHVSRLRTEDSGLYVCEMKTDENFGSAAAELVVSAAPEPLQVQRLNPQTENRSRFSLYIVLTLNVTMHLLPDVSVFLTKQPFLKSFSKSLVKTKRQIFSFLERFCSESP
uniref:Ig-like domain-containing protein n=1 Tax=Poecilia formosa TaxID=48698 RepID=A0A087YI30_POEFO